MKNLLLLGALALSINAFGQVPNYVPTNGLIHYFTFDNSYVDLINGINGSPMNGASFGNDRFNNSNSSLYLDGVDDYLMLNNTFYGSAAINSLSYSVWFKIPVLPPGSTTYTLSGKEGFWKTIYLNIYDDGMIRFGGTSTNVYFGLNSPSGAVIPNQWNHLVITLSGGNLNMYLNGLNISTGSCAAANLEYVFHASGNSTATNYIGAIHPVSPGVTNYFNGLIDDFGLWDRPLSACEISTLYLSQIQSLNSTEIVSACTSYQWIDGNTYTQSTNTPTFVLTNAQGCDSTVTLDLTITQPNTGSETVTECDSYTWSTNGQTYNQTGQYTSVLTNLNGCDSTVTLNLTITNSNTGSETVTECDSYTWNADGQTYTQSGQYTEVLSNQDGCDSTVTLNLTIETVDITTQPVDQNVVVGNNAQFTVVTSASNPTYQWQMDNGTGYMNLTNAGQYNGTDTDVLTISNVQLNQNNFMYRCVVISGNCETISSVARLTIQDNVGLDDINKNIFNVYPNPTSNSFTISSDKVINSEFTILDSQGREVLKGSMNGQEHTIDISKLSKGVYSVVFNNTEYPVVSVIKE